jgi:hypothetical protein
MNFRTSRIAAIGVGAVFVFAGIAGCGSSSSDDSSGELTKSEFISQADQICADASKASDAAGKDFVSQYKSGDYDAAADTIATATKINGDAFDKLGELQPPAADQAQVDAILAAGQKQVDLAPKLEDAVRNGDQAQIKELGAQSAVSSKEANKLADAYGLTDCGSGSQS